MANKNSEFESEDEDKVSVDARLQRELIRLGKKQLSESLSKLQSSEAMASESEVNEFLTHELQVHQIELEMQNRELRNAHKELEASRDRYADLYDFSPVSYMIFNEKGIIENINLTGSTLLKKQRVNIIGKPFVLWLEPYNTSDFFEHLRKVIQSGVKIVDEFKLKLTNAEFISIQMESVRSIDDENGYLCQSVIIDITESKRREVELHLRARQLKLITDSLPLQVAYLNADEKHLFANKTYIDWFGVTYTDVIGKAADKFWSKKYYSRVKSHLNIAYMGQPVTFDMELEGDGSATKYISVTIIPDFDINHLVCGVIMLIGDITDRLAIEVVDRQRLLDAAHFSRLNTMGEMASEIAHELNQPLAAISIYSDACKRFIKSQPFDDELIIKTLNDIGDQAVRAGQIIKHIRSLVSKKELMLSYTSVNDLIESAMELLAVELRSHNVQLSLNFLDDIPSAYIDEILIEQVIINLSRNAIDAMVETDSKERLLTIESSLINSTEFQVCIRDSGKGLSGKQLDSLFEPFNSTKADGMGLGLVICQSIVSAHHGRLWLDSKYTNGTVFCFKIPLMAEGFRDDE